MKRIAIKNSTLFVKIGITANLDFSCQGIPEAIRLLSLTIANKYAFLAFGI